MKKTITTIILGTVLFSTNSHAFYNSNSQFEDSTESTSYSQMQNMMLMRCGQTATEYSRLTGQDLEKILSSALSECKRILDTYNSIPDGMMPYENEISKFKNSKEKEFKKINNSVGYGGSGSKELKWDE